MNRDVPPDEPSELSELSGTFDEPSPDDRERREADWLLARERGQATAPPSEQTAADYQELDHLFATLPEPTTDASWQDAVLRKAMAEPAPAPKAAAAAKAAESPRPRERRPWWSGAPLRWATGALATASAAAAILFATVVPRGAAQQVTLAASHYERDIRGPEKRPDQITARGPRGELRIFRKPLGSKTGQFFARCELGSAQCKQDGDELELVLAIREPGEYYALSVDAPLDVPLSATMEEFREAANRKGLKVKQSDPVLRK